MAADWKPGYSTRVRCNQLSNCLDRVSLAWFLVGPQSKDSGKAESVSAFMTLRLLNAVKCDFNHHFWFDQTHPAVRKFPDCVSGKPISHLGQLGIGQAGVGLSYIQQFIVFF